MYSHEQRQVLLHLARQSIHWGLQHFQSRKIDVGEYDDSLQQPAASFVTLHASGQLRGCIGTLEAYRPLVVDVSDNAFAAAFRDPRFTPLADDEFADIDISISVLTKPLQMTFESEQDLLAQLHPGIDGVILQSGVHKATFLPAVWAQLPQAQQFLRHLKRKAGLSEDFWSREVKISRYQSESFAEGSEP